jgi:hypothetical protein
MTSRLQQLERVLQLLDSRGWSQREVRKLFYAYSPPDDRDGYRLFVPRDPAAKDFDKAIEVCVEALASFYDVPFSSIEALLLTSNEVVALRLRGDAFEGGVAPFPQFERMLEHLKRAITGAAAFLLTDDPIVQQPPNSARKFLDDCWFLQTARGSFVARVALPTSGDIGNELSLWTKRRPRELVGQTLHHMARLVGDRVLADDQTLFSEDGFKALRENLSVNVLEEFSRMLRGAAAERIDISFNRQGAEDIIKLPLLTHDRLHLLDTFIAFAREQLHATVDVDWVEGRVFKINKGRRGGRGNLVGLWAVVEGKSQEITSRVDSSVLPDFFKSLHTNSPIRIRGRARRLRTQLRIESDLQYEPVTSG